MTNNHTDEQTAAASAAMNRVLESEHAAEEAVAECERQAQALLQAGYARAQRITARTDERISLLRMRNIDRVTRQIEVMERAERAAQQDASPEHPQVARLACIVEELVDELSGGDTRASDGEAKP
jgi:regulator of protease activity HflC (stomatin/prohibitin superfamily)